MSDPRLPRRHLWLIAQRFLTELIALFGTPEAIAWRRTLLRARWRHFEFAQAKPTS